MLHSIRLLYLIGYWEHSYTAWHPLKIGAFTICNRPSATKLLGFDSHLSVPCHHLCLWFCLQEDLRVVGSVSKTSQHQIVVVVVVVVIVRRFRIPTFQHARGQPTSHPCLLQHEQRR